MKKYEQKNKELLENMQKFKKEKEKWKRKKQMMQQLKKEKKKRIKEELEKMKEEEKINEIMSIEKKNKFFVDILCEFLLKLNNSPYFLTVFDLLNNSLKNFEDLDYFAKMSLKYNLHINDIHFIFFSIFI